MIYSFLKLSGGVVLGFTGQRLNGTNDVGHISTWVKDPRHAGIE
jgi:hypothetical protein